MIESSMIEGRGDCASLVAPQLAADNNIIVSASRRFDILAPPQKSSGSKCSAGIITIIVDYPRNYFANKPVAKNRV
jgi:hypothetical protein